MTCYRLFFENQCDINTADDSVQEAPTIDMAQVTASVRAGQEKLCQQTTEDLILFFSTMAEVWSAPNASVQQAFKDVGLNFLLYWCRERHLSDMLNLSLRGDYHCLDNFVAPIKGQKALLASPRGIVCHWLAGNVPMLGMLSLIQGMLTKNANILKVSHQNASIIPRLLKEMTQIRCRNAAGHWIEGQDILQSVAALYIDSDDTQSQQALSHSADVRVAWGGQASVNAIAGLPKRSTTEDIIFGPRTSLMVIGQEMLENKASAQKLANRAAVDASVFEQRGCNAPHTIFVERGGAISALAFSEMLATAMQTTLEKYPKALHGAMEATHIAAARTQYDMFGQAFYPTDSLDWSVLYDESAEGLAQPVYNRTLFVRPVDSLESVVHYCSRQTQSVGLAVSAARQTSLAKQFARQGVDRLPAVGAMSAHESPWDGLFMTDRLVRWCALQT